MPSQFDYEIPMFTYAAEDGNAGPPTLLFHSEKGNLKQATLDAIANDPEYRTIMGECASEISVDGDCDIVARPDLEDLLVRMEHAQAGETALIASPDKNIPAHLIDLFENYYSCLKPHKLILGCVDCYHEGPANGDCQIKKLAWAGVNFEEENWQFVPTDELKKRLISRKSNIGGFTFVSPRLTAAEGFKKTIRSPDEHDFSQVRYRSNVVTRANLERGRINKFAETECRRCVMAGACLPGWGARKIQASCHGPYAQESVDIAAKEVIASVVIPYTRKQLDYCLRVSGPLDHRIGRFKYYLGFNMEGQVLTFGLRRKCRPAQFEPLLPFKRVKEVVARYGREPDPDHIMPTNDMTLATLIELTHWGYSPAHSSMFHGYTRWPLLTITRSSPRSNCLDVAFHKPHAGGGGVYHPSRFQRIQDLFDVFKLYRSLRTLKQTDSPLQRYKYQKAFIDKYMG